MDQNLIVGVDIGGSHITAALLDLETKQLVENSYFRQSIDAHGAATEIIASWAKVIRASSENIDLSSIKVGVAMPGPFDYERGISLIKDQDKFDHLYGLNVKELLASQLNLNPHAVRLLNDAACFLGGEIFAGAAKGAQDAIGLTLGTGLGSAIYHSNHAEDARLWCSSFRDGIAEDYLSARWFIKEYRNSTGKAAKNVREIALAAANDSKACAIFHEFGRSLAAFLLPIIQKETAEVIILGGNISNAAPLFVPTLEAQLLKANHKIPIKQASLGETAALIGAASSW